VTGHAYLLEIEGLFIRGSRPGRNVGQSVGGNLEMDSSDWSSGIRYYVIDTRPDTENKLSVSMTGHAYLLDLIPSLWGMAVRQRLECDLKGASMLRRRW
jgi:hypothetical protein